MSSAIAKLAVATLLGAVAGAMGGCAGTIGGRTAGAAVPAIADEGLRQRAGLTWPAAWSRPLPAERFGDFDDPLLQSLVAEALRSNADLGMARATLRRARALADAAAAGLALQVDSSASVGRSRSQRVERNSLRLGLDASWEADLFGATAQAVRAARLDADAAAATLEATRLSVAGEVAIAYLRWQLARTQLANARANLASLEHSRQLARWRTDAGLTSALDLEQAEAGVQQAQARIAALQLAREQGEHLIALLLGQPPTALSQRLADAREGVARVPALPPQGAPADLLRRRPDLRAAELDALAAWATLEQRRAERLPRFTLSGSLALQAASWGALGGPAALAASLAAGVRWPLLDGGAGRAQVASQQAALDGTEAAWRRALLGALQDVEDSLAAIARGTQQEAALARSVDAAQRSRDLTQLRYRTGLADFGALLDSERTLLGSRDGLAAARTDLALGHVRLAKALGGDWSAGPTDP